MRQRAAGNRCPLKGPKHKRIDEELTHFELQHWATAKKSRNIWGRNKSYGFRVRIVREPFSGAQVMKGVVFPLLSPLSTNPADAVRHQI